MQDAFAVKVLQAWYDLSQVIPHFWLGECVSGLPNVCQWLQRQSKEQTHQPHIYQGGNNAAAGYTPQSHKKKKKRHRRLWDEFTFKTHANKHYTILPSCCKAQGICKYCLGLQSDERISPHACVTGFCAARSHLWSVGEKGKDIPSHSELISWRLLEKRKHTHQTCTFSLWCGLDTLLCGITFTAYILLLEMSVIS